MAIFKSDPKCCPSLMLAARHFGLDSAPAVTLAAHPDLVRKELKIPDDLSIIIGIALGYADAGHPQNQYRTTRRSVLGSGDV